MEPDAPAEPLDVPKAEPLDKARLPESGVPWSWARRWPFVTAAVVGMAIWWATNAILYAVIPAALPVVGWVGYLAGVVVGTWLAGLKGARGWVVSPIITLASGAVLAGIVAVSGVRLPL